MPARLFTSLSPLSLLDALPILEEGLVGGPALAGAVPRGGYGRELIEHALPYALKATTSYELGATALHCSINIPLPEGEATGSPA
ncbi:hypothetical protein [Methylobacterium radiotolerans]|uniref:hypothetical protein n=1 Tax=Methylobacterium radiotolerans TaxID=31998 RepID=UPI003F668CEF